MSPDNTQANSPDAPLSREDLLLQIAMLGSGPFLHQVVQSPWHAVIDADLLHRHVKNLIRDLVDGCSKPQAIRCLTVVSPPGYGKTHLLAWTRETLDSRADAVFIFIPPYLGGASGNDSFDQHVMRATLDALWLRSHRQKACFEQAVRAFLVECYDRVVDSGQWIKEALRAGSFWSRLFRRYALKIAKRGPQGQLVALQKAFTRRMFFELAFADFCQRTPSGSDGVRADWDSFVAACLLTCGDARQRWHADRWFRGEPIPPDVFEPFHLDQPCQGTEKIRNGLYTLNGLVNQTFCLAFDQMEDTYLVLGQASPTGDASAQLGQLFAIMLRNMSVMPRFCMLFMFQLANWQEFARKAQPMLIERMTEGHGAQQLRALDADSAEELIRRRLDVAVWSQLAPVGSPEGEELFPFTPEDIRRIRVETGGELRAFLKLTQQSFDELLAAPVPPPPPKRIVLTSIVPAEVMSHEQTAVLISGENLPPAVQVSFCGQNAPLPPVCRPTEGQIDATTPTGLVGDVEVRVQSLDEPDNFATLVLQFRERELPRPYCQHIDPVKLKARRVELNLTQADVATKVSSFQPYISRLETGRWTDAPDDLYVRLADLYGAPLSVFLKRRS